MEPHQKKSLAQEARACNADEKRHLSFKDPEYSASSTLCWRVTYLQGKKALLRRNHTRSSLK